MEASKTSTLRNLTTSCQEKSFNTFEEGCRQNCSVIAPSSRGAITKDFNLGLSLPQRKPLTVDVYNQGCLNPWGGSVAFDPSMEARFQKLMQPLDPSHHEFHPPSYMMGIKHGGANVVSGWAPLEHPSGGGRIGSVAS